MQALLFFICKRVRHFGYDRTATQHSHTRHISLDSAQSWVKSQQFELPPLALDSTTVSNLPVVYWTFVAPNDLQNTLLKSGQ